MLKLTHITKSFGGVKALKNVSLEVRSGEIHALLGENGAGKSTLMKIISGAYQADSGQVEINGEVLSGNNPHLAKLHGISIIYQEFSLVPSLSVAENIYLGQQQGSWIHWKSMEASAQALIQSIGFELDVRKKVEELTVAQQQVVEIAKALSQDVKLLILDEPSAVLGSQEVKKLFSLLNKLKEKGVSIIYISHHLAELLAITDRITVLKDGRTITTVETREMDKNQLVNYMVGRELSSMYPEKKTKSFDAAKLEANHIESIPGKGAVSFHLHRGEILGIGGLVGSGRTEVLERLFGKGSTRAAQVNLDGKKVSLKSPRSLVKQKWAMLPEDRKKHGGILGRSIKENISLANLAALANAWGFISVSKEKKAVQELIHKLQIKIGDMENPLSSLSGGNQQKVILAKWLHLQPEVLLIDEPTRGVDVGARAEIYQIIQNLADSGLYILMVSSDMDELMGLSDRILVMKNGQIQGELQRADFSEERILRMAIGAN